MRATFTLCHIVKLAILLHTIQHYEVQIPHLWSRAVKYLYPDSKYMLNSVKSMNLILILLLKLESLTKYTDVDTGTAYIIGAFNTVSHLK